MANVDRLRLIVQGILALAVLAGSTYLGIAGVLQAEAISVLYGTALGAVGAGAVGGFRGATQPNGIVSTFTDREGATVRTERGQHGGA